MGKWASASRRDIKQAFEAACGDMRGEVEPMFLMHAASGKDAATAELRVSGNKLEALYQLLDPTLDDADFERIFHIAYLDVLTGHHWSNQNRGRYAKLQLTFCNRATGAARTVDYPDPE